MAAALPRVLHIVCVWCVFVCTVFAFANKCWLTAPNNIEYSMLQHGDSELQDASEAEKKCTEHDWSSVTPRRAGGNAMELSFARGDGQGVHCIRCM
jgi:hypothetical protein